MSSAVCRGCVKDGKDPACGRTQQTLDDAKDKRHPKGAPEPEADADMAKQHPRNRSDLVHYHEVLGWVCSECGHNIGVHAIKASDSLLEAVRKGRRASLAAIRDQKATTPTSIKANVNRHPCIVCGRWCDKNANPITLAGADGADDKPPDAGSTPCAHITENETVAKILGAKTIPGVEFAKSERNFLPLCGLQSTVGSCHYAFDHAMLHFIKVPIEEEHNWWICFTTDYCVEYNPFSRDHDTRIASNTGYGFPCILDLGDYSPSRSVMHNKANHALITMLEADKDLLLSRIENCIPDDIRTIDHEASVAVLDWLENVTPDKSPGSTQEMPPVETSKPAMKPRTAASTKKGVVPPAPSSADAGKKGAARVVEQGARGAGAGARGAGAGTRGAGAGARGAGAKK